MERIKTDMAAIRGDPQLTQDQKQSMGEVKMQELYAASGEAKIKGAVEQVERALEEGAILCFKCWLAYISKGLTVSTCALTHNLLSFREPVSCSFYTLRCFPL